MEASSLASMPMSKKAKTTATVASSSANNTANYQPSYTKQDIYNDLAYNQGPQNLALQLNKNAHKGKTYAK